MTDAPELIALRWEPGAAVTSGPLMTHPEYTQYRRADQCFTADDLRRVFAIAIEMAGDTAKSIRLNYDVMKPDQITYEPMRVQRAAKGMVRIAEDDIRALTPPDDLAARVKEGRDD